MPIGWYGLLCAICFKPLEPKDCLIDRFGAPHDLCSSECASKTFSPEYYAYLFGGIPWEGSS